MASNTINLNLLKKDPLTDGNDTFNIKTMLNDNWDKIDEFAGKTTPISKGGTGATTAAQALANLGGIATGAVGNLHVWERVQTYAEPVPEVPAGYTLGNVETDVVISSGGTTTIGWITDPSEITVEYDGTVVFPSNSSGSTKGASDWAKSSYYASMQGKYCHVSQEAGTHVDGITFFFPANARLSYVSGTGLVASKLQRVIGYPYTPAIPAGTTTDYLTSTDRNAYPDNVTDAQDAHYTLGDVVTNVSLGADRNTYIHYDVSDNVVVDESGNVTLGDTTRVVIGYGYNGTTDTVKSALAGKFIKVYANEYSGSSDTHTFIPKNTIAYIPSDVSITQDGLGPKHFIGSYQPVTGHAAIPANTTITYLGQLGGGARIEVGTYIGTGIESADILIGFTPKAVLIPNGSSFYSYSSYDSAFILPGLPNQENVKRAEIIDGGFRVYYYNNSSVSRASYLNNSGETYRYIAIG